MIRAVYRDGLIHPTDPVPSDWTDGQPLEVEPAAASREPSDDPADIDAWYKECKRLGPMRFEPGEWERVQAALEEADRLAKDFVRRRMESGQ